MNINTRGEEEMVMTESRPLSISANIHTDDDSKFSIERVTRDKSCYYTLKIGSDIGYNHACIFLTKEALARLITALSNRET